MSSSTIRYLLCCFLLLQLLGCQLKVYLMPVPVGMEKESSFFFLSEESADENNLYTLYATNRVSTRKIKNSAGYSIFPSGKLEIGFLVFSVGHEGMSWNELG